MSTMTLPIFEVGDPVYDDPARGYRCHAYGPADAVCPTTFGVPQANIPHPDAPSMAGLDLVRLHSEDRYVLDVPVTQVVVCQHYVYRPHVENLVTIPGERLFHDHDPIEGVLVEHRDGTRVYVEHGTHRTVAAVVRGDATVKVRITDEYRAR